MAARRLSALEQNLASSGDGAPRAALPRGVGVSSASSGLLPLFLSAPAALRQPRFRPSTLLAVNARLSAACRASW